MNFYSLQTEAEQRARELQIEADAQRIGRKRDVDIDTRNIDAHSQYLGRLIAKAINKR